MRGVILVLTILMPAITARAAVTIICTPGTGPDCNLVTVNYAVSGEPNKVRAFALDITVDNGAKIKSISDLNSKYWVYPGSIVILNGEVNDVGTPIGDMSKFPGTLGGLDTNGITIEMGALYYPASDNSPYSPPLSGTLLKFKVACGEGKQDCNVVVAENTVRGGVVLTNPSVDPTVTAAGCKIVYVGECFPKGYTTYADWVRLGMPDCWCGTLVPPPRMKWPFQCDGDADNGGAVLSYRVYANDLTILANNWKKKGGNPTLNPCADFDHKGQVADYRVYTNDLTILSTNWKKKAAQLPGNCPRPE